MNVALIFAGGTGTRMNSKTKPKQFIELDGKAIIIYTLEVFEGHPDVDAIVVVCLGNWITYLNQLITAAGLEKVVNVVPGGENAQESQYHGLRAIKEYCHPNEHTIVLVHDGVRPLVDKETISKNIKSVKELGSAITVTPAIETVIKIDDNGLLETVLERNKCRMAKAPQSFFFKDLYAAHVSARNEKKLDFIDSASLMQYYGYSMHVVDGTTDNIKITTQTDYGLFRAIVENKKLTDNVDFHTVV